MNQPNKQTRTSFFSSCCVNIFPIGTKKPYPLFFTSRVYVTRRSRQDKKDKMPHVILEFGFLLAQVLHLLYKVTP